MPMLLHVLFSPLILLAMTIPAAATSLHCAPSTRVGSSPWHLQTLDRLEVLDDLPGGDRFLVFLSAKNPSTIPRTCRTWVDTCRWSGKLSPGQSHTAICVSAFRPPTSTGWYTMLQHGAGRGCQFRAEVCQVTRAQWLQLREGAGDIGEGDELPADFVDDQHPGPQSMGGSEDQEEDSQGQESNPGGGSSDNGGNEH